MRRNNRKKEPILNGIITSIASCLRRRSLCQGRNTEMWRSSARDAPSWPVSICLPPCWYLALDLCTTTLTGACVFPSSSASSSFPYLKKRIQVVEQQSTEMNPIEVAIDEMSRKVSELNQLCDMEEVDMIRLQLKLQGSVSVKVGNSSEKQRCILKPLHVALYCLTFVFSSRWMRGLWLMPGHF